MRPWWISELAVSEEEYDKVVVAAMDELDEQQCSMDWVIYTARKPIASSASTSTENSISHHTTSITFADTAPTISTKT